MSMAFELLSYVIKWPFNNYGPKTKMVFCLHQCLNGVALAQKNPSNNDNTDNSSNDDEDDDDDDDNNNNKN